MGWPPEQRICPFLTMCMVSMPAMIRAAVLNDLKPIIGLVRLLIAR